MKVIDLNDEHKELYFVCLEDWNVETAEAGDHKRIWYNAMKEKGLSDALFINGKEIRTGPPPSFNKIRKKIARQVKKTFKS